MSYTVTQHEFEKKFKELSLKIRAGSNKYKTELLDGNSGFIITVLIKGKEYFFYFNNKIGTSKKEIEEKYWLFFKRKKTISTAELVMIVSFYTYTEDDRHYNPLFSTTYKSDEWFYKEIHNLLRQLILRQKKEKEEADQKSQERLNDKHIQVVNLIKSIK